MTDVLAELRTEFPVRESWIYLNHAAVAPLPNCVVAAVNAFLRDANRNGSTGFAHWMSVREQVRADAARLLGAQPSEVAITTSTSQGLLTVAEGLEFGPGDEILVIQDDFPANLIPWWRQKRRGAEVRVVPRRADGRVPASDVLAAVTPATKLVAIPWVLYDTGFRLDLPSIGAGLVDHPALFCVDAIQGLGAFPIDVEAAHIDFLSADSHKWMLGMEGIGLFYVRAAALERLDAPFTSWLSVEDPFTPWEPGRPLLPDARRFEYASLPTMEIFGLGACLELLLRTDPARMGPRVLELTDQLTAGLQHLGWTLRSPRAEPTENSGIVLATPPDRDASTWVDRLAERGVSVIPRAGGLRFSPHAWNTAEELERLFALLRELA
ncbi:MAG: cysteine desulfurase [Planctomycetota bacterium]|nr:MAG: cysteine desulfurase [Planctomycetota bacterium]